MDVKPPAICTDETITTDTAQHWNERLASKLAETSTKESQTHSQHTMCISPAAL